MATKFNDYFLPDEETLMQEGNEPRQYKGAWASMSPAARERSLAYNVAAMLGNDEGQEPVAPQKSAVVPAVPSGGWRPEKSATSLMSEAAKDRSLAANVTGMLGRYAEGKASAAAPVQPVPTVQTPIQKTEGVPAAPVAAMTETPAAKVEIPPQAPKGIGGDELDIDRMLSAANWIRAMESTGSAISGKNLRSGIADALGEQARQVEALRLKRAEKAEDITREQAQYEAANLATLTTNLAAFKDRPDIVAALENMRSGAKFTKPSDFTKGVFQAVTNPPKVKGLEAGAEKTGAQVGDVQAASALKQGKAKALTYTDALTQARTDSEVERKGVLAAQADALRAKAELDRARAAGSTDVDPKTVNARQKLVDAYQKEYLKPAESLTAVEAVAPGLTKGSPPSWLDGRELELVRNNATYELASDQTKDVFAAAQKYLDGYRKQQYGSALTATEQAELERLVKADIFTGADKLSRFFDLIRRDIANNFQNKLKGDRLVQQTFVDKYVDAAEGPLAKFVGPEGLFADVWTLRTPTKTPAAAPAPTAAPATGVTIMRGPDNKLYKMPNDKVADAEKDGFKKE